MSATPVDANARPADSPDLAAIASAGPFSPLPEGAALIAIGGSPSRLVAATPAALAALDSADLRALEALLLRGDGPSARRLRHLAVSLPAGAPPRLEAFRFAIGRRTLAVTTQCVRIVGEGGEPILILALPTPPLAAAASGLAATGTAPAPAPGASPLPQSAPVAIGSRFLWSVDAAGRFAAPDPMLAAALGAQAPRTGETFAELAERIGLAEDCSLGAALARRATFASERVEWLLEGGARRALLFSAAPLFDRSRAFAGLQGFGVVGETVAAGPATPEGGVADAGPLERQLSSPAPEPAAVDAAAPQTIEDERQQTDDVAESAAAPTLDHVPAPSEGGVCDALGSPESDGAAPGPETAIEAFDPASPEMNEVAPLESALPAPMAPQSEEAPRLEAPEIAAFDPEPEAMAKPAPSVAPTSPQTESAVAAAGMAEPIATPEDHAGAEAAPESPELDIAAPAGAPPAAPEEPARDLSPQSGPSAGPLGPATTARSAEIFLLRNEPPATAAPNVVPIRPGVLDAATPRHEAGESESVELTTSERDAFREIARALVGRAPGAQADKPSALTPFDAETANPVAAARDVIDLAFGAQAPTTAAAPQAPPVHEASSGAQAQSTRLADADVASRNAAAVLERLPVGALVTREARALYLNRTLLDLLGYRDLAEFEAADGLNAMFRGRDPESLAPADDAGALPLVKADGEVIAVDGHAQPIQWDGAPATLIALRRSLEADFQTRLRAAERDARARSGAASDLQQILDRATDGAVMLDATARILSVSRPGEALFGYDQKEIAGESLLMLLAPQSHPETTRRLDALSRADESDSPGRPFEVVGRERGGGARPLMLTLGRIGPLDAPHYCALFRDLAPEREAERRLGAARDAAQAASLAKTDFLAHVSHEIRTPLHAILGFAEVMIEERFGPIGNERYKDYLKDIHASGKHVMSLADDLLDLTKVESGKLELRFEPVDANALIRDCVALMQPQAAHERIIMRTSLLDRLPKVIVDERSLKQIMLNLMSNAVKFNEPGGQVIVSTALDAAGQAVIRVRDTGVGMNENEIAIALTPFGRVGSSRRAGGTGLGLPLTKALVEANKAEFTIKSRREQGTLIEIAFPLVEAAQ